MKRQSKFGHQRIVCVSVCLPVTVELLVETMDDPVDEDTDWEIAAVRRVDCDAYPTMVRENMRDDEYDDLRAKARDAKDV